MKPGIYTTEFWLLLVVVAALFIALCAGVLPPQYATVALTILPLGWAALRFLAKRTPETTDDRLLDAIESLISDKGRRILGSPAEQRLEKPEPPHQVELPPGLRVVPDPNKPSEN